MSLRMAVCAWTLLQVEVSIEVRRRRPPGCCDRRLCRGDVAVLLVVVLPKSFFAHTSAILNGGSVTGCYCYTLLTVG